MVLLVVGGHSPLSPLLRTRVTEKDTHFQAGTHPRMPATVANARGARGGELLLYRGPGHRCRRSHEPFRSRFPRARVESLTRLTSSPSRALPASQRGRMATRREGGLPDPLDRAAVAPPTDVRRADEDVVDPCPGLHGGGDVRGRAIPRPRHGVLRGVPPSDRPARSPPALEPSCARRAGESRRSLVRRSGADEHGGIGLAVPVGKEAHERPDLSAARGGVPRGRTQLRGRDRDAPRPGGSMSCLLLRRR